MKRKLLVGILSFLPVMSFADSSWVVGKITNFTSIGETVFLQFDSHHSSSGCAGHTDTAAIRISTIHGASQADYAFSAFNADKNVHVLVNDTVCEAVGNPIIHSFKMVK